MTEFTLHIDHTCNTLYYGHHPPLDLAQMALKGSCRPSDLAASFNAFRNIIILNRHDISVSFSNEISLPKSMTFQLLLHQQRLPISKYKAVMCRLDFIRTESVIHYMVLPAARLGIYIFLRGKSSACFGGSM